jgi:hypothetical protein
MSIGAGSPGSLGYQHWLCFDDIFHSEAGRFGA